MSDTPTPDPPDSSDDDPMVVPGVGRVMRFFVGEDGHAFVSVVDVALYLQDIARLERKRGREVVATAIAAAAISLLDSVLGDVPPDSTCPDCGEPTGSGWEDGFLLCDACARRRVLAGQPLSQPLDQPSDQPLGMIDSPGVGSAGNHGEPDSGGGPQPNPESETVDPPRGEPVSAPIPIVPSDSIPAECPLCQAEFEKDHTAQFHYRVIINNGGPEEAYAAFNEDWSERHAEHMEQAGQAGSHAGT